MKLSSKALACGQSPMRKFHPYAVAAAAAGKKIYHLNIGQPDIHTPDALYDAIHSFRTPVLAYAASPGIPELIEAIRKYYEAIGVGLDEADILITAGGSEALQIAANCLLDDGDEVIVAEPFYPNYHTFITTAGGVIHIAPITVSSVKSTIISALMIPARAIDFVVLFMFASNQISQRISVENKKKFLSVGFFSDIRQANFTTFYRLRK